MLEEGGDIHSLPGRWRGQHFELDAREEGHPGRRADLGKGPEPQTEQRAGAKGGFVRRRVGKGLEQQSGTSELETQGATEGVS